MMEISKTEIQDFQNLWGDAIVEIGKLYLDKKDYQTAAINLVNRFYGYNEGPVLFKPTRAQHSQFRTTAKGAISYFVGNNTEFDEDTGFALQPWKKVRFENSQFILGKGYAISMGNYFFTDMDGNEKMVEYTFGVTRSVDGSLKINLHHSSLPYIHPEN